MRTFRIVNATSKKFRGKVVICCDELCTTDISQTMGFTIPAGEIKLRSNGTYIYQNEHYTIILREEHSNA
jgi:hypothetical protein